MPMNTKAEITKLWNDVQASAREFASLGLEAGTKALEKTGVRLKSLEETLKRTAEKLKTNGHGEKSESIKQ